MTNEEAGAAKELPPIEAALRTHPGVRDVALIDLGAGRLAAFIVPDDAFLNDALGRRTSAAASVGKWRKASDLSQLAKEAAYAPAGFNTLGWNSSYTQRPIPADQMREWVDTTVAEILELAPKDVYEIGCGTGMPLMRIAPHCNRYVAADFSPVVLGRVREQLQTSPDVASRLEIAERSADNFDGIEENAFDTVVLNSIIQYFPNASYLTTVLEKAIRATKPGGRVYVGDVRSLPLLPAYAASVELFQSGDESALDDLRARVRRRIEREPELVVSPSYFLSLPSLIAKLTRVEIQPRRGRADNEMTRYRYSATLYVGDGTRASWSGDVHDWQEKRWTLDDIRSLLLEHSGEPCGIMRIRNSRVEKDLAILAALDDAETIYRVGGLRREIEQAALEGIHPQSLIELSGEGLGFAVSLSWAASRPDGSFDAYFIPKAHLQGTAKPAIAWPKPEPAVFARFTNKPGQSSLYKELTNQLAAYCSQNLPGDMLPQKIELLDAIVRRSDGNVDTAAMLSCLNKAPFWSQP